MFWKFWLQIIAAVKFFCFVSRSLDFFIYFKLGFQDSTIGVYHICMYAYFCCCTHDFGHAYVDTFANFFHMIFQSFQKISGSYNFLFKNLLIWIWPSIYLFVLGRDRFCTVYICFKETLFFCSIFHTKLFDVSPYVRALDNLVCQKIS